MARSMTNSCYPLQLSRRLHPHVHLWHLLSGLQHFNVPGYEAVSPLRKLQQVRNTGAHFLSSMGYCRHLKPIPYPLYWLPTEQSGTRSWSPSSVNSIPRVLPTWKTASGFGKRTVFNSFMRAQWNFLAQEQSDNTSQTTSTVVSPSATQEGYGYTVSGSEGSLYRAVKHVC